MPRSRNISGSLSNGALLYKILSIDQSNRAMHVTFVIFGGFDSNIFISQIILNENHLKYRKACGEFALPSPEIKELEHPASLRFPLHYTPR